MIYRYLESGLLKMDEQLPQKVVKLFVMPELFDSAWYSDTYLDVSLSGMSPHVHYQKFGVLMGRAPNPEIQKYLETLP